MQQENNKPNPFTALNIWQYLGFVKQNAGRKIVSVRAKKEHAFPVKMQAV